MATITSVKSGNWSDPTVWDSGAVPVDGDTVVAANHTIQLDVDVNQPTTLLVGSGVDGGFVYGDAGTRTVRANAGGISSINNNANWRGVVRMSGTGTLILDGLAMGNSVNAPGAVNNAAGTLTVTTATGGSGANAPGAVNSGGGTLTVTTATGGSGANAYGAYNNAAGTLTVTTATGNNGGPGGSTANMNAGVYGSATSGAITRVRRIVYGAYGSSPTAGAVMIEPAATNSAQFRAVYNGATKTLVDSAAGADLPAVGDVRGGTIYNVGNMTGTLAVPAAGSVALGVPVDAGVGTAVLTAAAVGAQLETALGTTARAEPVAVPAANASFAAKLNWIYALLRNKRIEDIDGARLRDSTDTADIGTTAMDDTAGVFTQGGWQ